MFFFFFSLRTARSEGLAICHQGKQRGTPPLTAFSLSGCGDGTTAPLDESEWKGQPSGASGSFSAPDDQQLTASYGGGVVHFDCRRVVATEHYGCTATSQISVWNMSCRQTAGTGNGLSLIHISEPTRPY